MVSSIPLNLLIMLVAKTYANLCGINYPLDDEKSDESMMEEVVDDEAFVLELTSDSELSDNE